MKLKAMSVWFNNYDFTNDGVPPKTYAGQAEFTLGSADVVVKLDQHDIDMIMQTITAKVVNSCSTLSSINARVVQASAHNNILEAPL